MLVGLFLVSLAMRAAGNERRISVADYRDRMAGAWLGQSVGVAYGWPTEFRYVGKMVPDEKMPTWKAELINETFNQDDLYVEMTFLHTLEMRGIDVGVREAGIDFANSRYRLWCANANARNLIRNGIAAPASSHPKNHPTPDDIDYQIESDFAGILSPGMPQRVVKLGEQFGRIMNHGDGLYAGVFIGALYSEAYFESDRRTVVERALKAIPSDCRYAEMVRDMLTWHKADPQDWRGAWRQATDKWYADGKSPLIGKVSFAGIDVKINGAMVLLGYLWGDGDILKTARIATQGGYDSDCNPSSALGVLGVQLGAKAFGAAFAGGLSKTNRWEFTTYTYDGLLAVCEKLTRQLVVAEGGRIGTDAQGEFFILPEKAYTPVVASDRGDERLTPAENRCVRYLPNPDWGERSFPKPEGFPQWRGLRVAVLGDSITDPNQSCRLYWQHLADWCGWDVKCYGVSGNAWCHIPAQSDRMIAEMGEKVDAILILIGTNDYAGGRPLGQWYDEMESEVNWWGQMHKLKHRAFNRTPNTVRGDANIALEKLKKRYPLAQIVLMTPTKRAFFTCGGNNIQPSEDWPNTRGLHLEDYAAVTREAGAIWSCPVIDLGAECGLMPLLKDAHCRFFRSKETDLLHPNAEGHLRMAKSIYYRLGALPGTFR